MKEARLWNNHLKPWLTARGFMAVRMAFNGTGQTDCFAYRRPHYFGLELKTITAKTAAGAFAEMERKHGRAQRMWRDKVVASGGIHVLMGANRKGELFAIVTRQETNGLAYKLAFYGKEMTGNINEFFKLFYTGGL